MIWSDRFLFQKLYFVKCENYTADGDKTKPDKFRRSEMFQEEHQLPKGFLK